VRGYGQRHIGVGRHHRNTGPVSNLGVIIQERPHTKKHRHNPYNRENEVFIDGGAVATKAGDHDPVCGVGTGIRFNSPVGPLQLDLAYGLETKRFRIHLKVGFTF
jgi:translocation and assembly module TamA